MFSQLLITEAFINILQNMIHLDLFEAGVDTLSDEVRRFFLLNLKFGLNVQIVDARNALQRCKLMHLNIYLCFWKLILDF